MVTLLRCRALSSARAWRQLVAEEGIGMAVAIKTKKRWTLAELHSLPEDGNKYELLRGDLLATPPPTDPHETIAARITRLLDPFVAAHGLGFVYRPRAVFRYEGSELEPDLMVRAAHPQPRSGWDKAPKPILIVEILSPSTRRRDFEMKRAFYVDAGIHEYWIVDPESREVTVVRSGQNDLVTSDVLLWTPPEAAESLSIQVPRIFES